MQYLDKITKYIKELIATTLPTAKIEITRNTEIIITTTNAMTFIFLYDNELRIIEARPSTPTIKAKADIKIIPYTDPQLIPIITNILNTLKPPQTNP